MYEPTSCLNLYIHSSLEPKISWLNSSCEQRLVPVPLRLRQCERSSHLCKQRVKGKRLADCKHIIRHAAFTPVKSLAVIGLEEPFPRRRHTLATGDLRRSSGGSSVASANANAKRRTSSYWVTVHLVFCRTCMLLNIQLVSDTCITEVQRQRPR